MDTTEAMVEKLASKLDDDELGILVGLMDKVAYNAASVVMTQEQQREAMVEKLASSGYSLQEIQGELQKIAEEKATQDECEKIAQDCVAMGNIIGKTASEVFLNNIRNFVDKNAASKEDVKEAVKEVEEEEEKEESKEEVEEAKEELKDAKEEAKMASQRDQLRALLLQASQLS